MTCPLYRFRKLTISLILFPVLKTMQKLKLRMGKRMNLSTILNRLQPRAGNQENEEIFKDIENAEVLSNDIVENAEEIIKDTMNEV